MLDRKLREVLGSVLRLIWSNRPSAKSSWVDVCNDDGANGATARRSDSEALMRVVKAL